MHIDLSQDFDGEHYNAILGRLHDILKPKSYLEIGVCNGHTLTFSKCDTVAVDPQFEFNDIDCVRFFVKNKTVLQLFQMTSDEFFSRYSLSELFGRPADMVFLDGMHRSEYLLRDFINTERSCRKNSVIILHDCLPLESGMTARVATGESIVPHRADWWTGDVWRTALLLKRERPDLLITAINAQPTGLVLITNLDNNSSHLSDNYHTFVERMHGWHLDDIGIASFFNEMNLEHTSVLGTDELITRRYWL